MKCPNCGYELEKPNLKNCPACGHKLKRERVVVPPAVKLNSSETSSTDADVKESDRTRESEQSTQTRVVTPRMVECPFCHQFISEDSNFCPRCGYNMREQESSSPQEEIVPEQGGESELPIAFETLLESTEKENFPVDSGDYMEEEDASDSDMPDNVRDEDLDEDIDNGSYQPYSEEDEESPVDTNPQKDVSTSSSWFAVIITVVVGILTGALLSYLFF